MVSKKKKKADVIRFPPPREEPTDSTVICQIGIARFAIHFEIEDLPPVKPATPIKKGLRPA